MSEKKLLELEGEAKKLEVDEKERLQIRKEVVTYTESFIDEINDLEKQHAYNASESKAIELLKHPIGEPYSMKKLVRLTRDNVDKTGLNPASGGHLGYIPGGGVYASSLGDYWAAITNRYAGIFFANPGAVRMENHLINWMKSIINYPDEALGNLTSGGSIANLIAVVAAREAAGLRPSDYENAVIYLSPQTHHCIDKALNIAGFQYARMRRIPLDEKFRMKPDILKIMIQEDRENGLNPWMVVASAGTTDTGAIDPIEEIGAIAKENNLWLHVDAAYGGFFVLVDEYKERLRALSKADSVVMDPHKGLFLPYGIGVVLVKNGREMKHSFKFTANYMQDTEAHLDETSPAEVSPELTKHFRGLRMWLPLMYHGIKPFSANLEEKILLARYFYDMLSKNEEWELGPYPQLSVVIFRYIDTEDVEAFNRELVQKIHADGRVFLSSTTVDGKFIIRLAVLSFRTHKETIDLTLEILKEKVEEIKKTPAFVNRGD